MIFFIVALFCFVIKGLAVLFAWDLHKFDAIAWGLAFLTLGHLLPLSGPWRHA